jgi:prepilin-type N-terminal cleavage/methylation domain-containing protein
MKSKAFSLIEVLISITILSTLLIILLNVKGQNLFLIEKMKDVQFNNTIIALGAHSDTDKKSKIYIKDIIKTPDNNLRKQLKDTKVMIKKDLLNQKVLTINDWKVTIKNYETKFTFDKQIKLFYSFELSL